MAPTKNARGRGGSSKGQTSRRRDISSGRTNPKKKQSAGPKKAIEQKTKPIARTKRKQPRQYTEQELNVQKLNTIVPAGVKKPQGKKKGKVFVDDQESMMAIMAMVSAEKQGQIESKVAEQRRLQEIREARQKELEARAEKKKAQLEETKDSLRRKQKPGASKVATEAQASRNTGANVPQSRKKRVSFG